MNLSFRVHAPIAFVYSYLADLDKFASVHPVIDQIELIEKNKFIVHETLSLSLFSFSFTYPVQVIERIENKKIHLQATVFQLVRINMCFKLTDELTYISVKEEITLQTWIPIQQLMYTLFKKMHHQLMQNIEQAYNLEN